MFDDRIHAAGLLAERLLPFRDRHPLVLAIPRGGVPMAALIADRLETEWDTVLVRKLRPPAKLELAIGAVSEDGRVHVLPVARRLLVSEEYLRDEAAAQLEEIRRLRALYSGGRPRADPGGREVILLDDGIATGATFLAALRAVRAGNPARIVAAAAVTSPEAARRVSAEADDCVFLETPKYFQSVGAYFRRFAPVPDEEVCRYLRNSVRAFAWGDWGNGQGD